MPIWSVEIKELVKLYESFKGQLPALEKELEQLIRTDDANVIMLYSRRCLEVILTDLCECELKRSRGTEPLKGIIDKLHKERKVPDHISTSMHGLNDLSTYGAHPKDFDPEQVKPVLNNLDIIIKWFLNYKESGAKFVARPVEQIRQEIKSPETEKKSIQIPKNILIGSLSGLVLVILIVFSVLFFTKPLEKSIAVLPFINESPVDSNKHFINGIMEEILNNLQTIKDFRVLSRTSTDQYQGPDRPTIREIAKKLGVNYIIEGSGQKYGNTFRLSVQLIKAKGKEDHLWNKPFQREIRKTTDLFSIQSQIAQAIAAELKVVITPDEKQLIEKVPTANLTALEFYQMGREEEKFPYYLILSSTIAAGVNPPTKQSLERAEKMYRTSLKYDSTFAPAYTGLAGIYWNKKYLKEYLSENFMDSVLFLVKEALSFDDQLPDAHFLMGMYYSETDNYKKALEELDKTLKLNPNSWQAFFAKGEIDEDVVLALKNYYEAASHHQGPGLSEIYNKMSFKLSYTGFSELAKNYSLKAVNLESDSSIYYFWLWMYEFEYEKCLQYYKKRYSVDSTDITAIQFLSDYYSVTGQFKESLKFYKKGGAGVNGMQRVGYAYWKNGFKDSADYYFNKQIENCNDAIRLGRSSYSTTAHYDLAGVYALRGDKIKAYENLKIFSQKPSKWYLWIVRFIKYDPLFDRIRNEPMFQQIAREMEVKRQAAHDRAGKWLKEQGMLQ